MNILFKTKNKVHAGVAWRKITECAELHRPAKEDLVGQNSFLFS